MKVWKNEVSGNNTYFMKFETQKKQNKTLTTMNGLISPKSLNYLKLHLNILKISEFFEHKQTLP